MEKKEKVTLGYECCVVVRKCDKCPYRICEDGAICTDVLLEDAVSLIMAREKENNTIR